MELPETSPAEKVACSRSTGSAVPVGSPQGGEGTAPLYDGLPVLAASFRDIQTNVTSRISHMAVHGCKGSECLFGTERFAQWEDAQRIDAFRCVNQMIINGHLPLEFAGPIGSNRYVLGNYAHRAPTRLPSASAIKTGIAANRPERPIDASLSLALAVAHGPSRHSASEVLKGLLQSINQASSRRKVIAAIWNETNGSREGFELAEAWCLRVNPTANPGDLEGYWDSFQPGASALGIVDLIELAATCKVIDELVASLAA